MTSELHAGNTDRINSILAYRNDRLIQRYSLDHGEPVDIAEARFNGFKQFMIVCATMPGRKIASDAIDAMWHSFLLFSRDYREFCTESFGKMIDHQPFEVPNPDRYLETRQFAAILFGGLDPAVWPLTAKGDCSSGCEDS